MPYKKLCQKCAHEYDVEFYVMGFVMVDKCDCCGRVSDLATVKIFGGGVNFPSPGDGKVEGIKPEKNDLNSTKGEL